MEKIKAWIPSFLIAVAILYFSLIKGTTVDKMGLGKESYHINGHFILYFLLTVTLFKPTKKILLPAVFSTFFGVLNEFFQLYVPGRSSSLFDIMVNSLGVLLAGILLWKLQRFLPKKLKNWLQS